VNAPLDKSLHKMDSTEELRLNERFSPIPFKKPASPPMSPPPLDLPPVVGSNFAGLDKLPRSVETYSSYVSMSPPRQSVLEVERVLRDFEHVEKALQKSPYIIPQDLYFLNQQNRENPPAAQEIENTNEDVETNEEEDPVPRVIEEGLTEIQNAESAETEVPQASEEEAVKGEDVINTEEKAEDGPQQQPDFLEESQWSLVGQSQIDLAEIVANYSVPEDVNTATSSPFVEHVKSRSKDLDADPPPSFKLRPSPATSSNGDVNETQLETPLPNDSMEVTDLNLLTVTEPKLSRMSSLQRRGQDYLNSFLARRQRRLAQDLVKSEPATPSFALVSAPSFDFVEPRRKVSPVTIILVIFLLLSMIMNVVQWRENKLLKVPKEDILDEIMTPGRVGETFDIFTTPSTSSSWDLWSNRNAGADIFVSSEASLLNWGDKAWRGYWKFGRKLSFGARRKREQLLNLEREFVGFCWRGISLLEELWNQVRRR
jgi:hypothetical protein